MIYSTPEGNTVVGQHDQRTLDQLDRCTRGIEGARGALMPDGHLGYSAPIGAVLAYPEHVSPSGVGYDIGCGNMAVRTNIYEDDIDIAPVMDEIVKRVSFGMGRVNGEPIDHPVLDAITGAYSAEQRALSGLARNQLGTVGAGNHYVDLFKDAEGVLWIGVHFGSRGFGHKTASGFLNLAKGREWSDRVQGEPMDAEPTLLNVNTYLGQSYIEAMKLAGQYAYAGREVVVQTVLDILGADVDVAVHNHHNYAWHEEHGGQKYWVVRKGATPATPGQRGFVGATMGEASVILEGAWSETAPDLMWSTVHGAGRAMSRTAAAGKVRRRKLWGCPVRECSVTFDGINGGSGNPAKLRCPIHGEPPKKFYKDERKSEGLINWPQVQAEMRQKGIVLRGGAADEAPGAYKRLADVLYEAGDTVNVLWTLQPVGVAMAGADTFDPFKD